MELKRKAGSIVALSLVLFAYSASACASTIVSVPKGIAGSPAIEATQFLEENWTSTVGFSDVTISAFVNTYNVADSSAVAYLTTQVGPGATSAELVAQANLTLPVGLSSPELVLFSGLNLSPANYYLILATTDTTGNEGWFNGDLYSSSAVTAPGVTFNPPGFVAHTIDAAYAPGSTFSGTYIPGYAFDVVGNVSPVPEPSSLSLALTGVLLAAGTMLAQRRSRPL